MQVWVLGHSFISRLKQHFLKTDTYPSFPDSGHVVHFTGIPGSHITGPRAKVLQSLTPASFADIDIVYLALGTNDLDSGTPPHKVAQHFVSFANYIVVALGVKMVILDQIIPRASPQSAALASCTNQHINTLLATGEYPHIKIWTHQTGFWNNIQAYLDPRDGVHLNQRGMVKYWKSIRGAILWAIPRVQK